MYPQNRETAIARMLRRHYPDPEADLAGGPPHAATNDSSAGVFIKAGVPSFDGDLCPFKETEARPSGDLLDSVRKVSTQTIADTRSPTHAG